MSDSSLPPASSLHVTEWGHANRVILVHGGTPGGGTVAFRAQQPLAQRWQMILPDRPGHGASPKQGRGDYERDAQLLDPLLECGGAHLVGHSYGGVVALCMAAARPRAVRSLVLIEPPAFCFGRGVPEVEEMAEANRRLFEDPPVQPGELFRRFFALVGMDAKMPDPLPPPLQEAERSLIDLRGPYEAEIYAEDLTAGNYPILVLTSGQIAGFEAIADRIAAQTGGAHVVVPDTDHTVQDAGEPVNRLLEEHWRSVM